MKYSEYKQTNDYKEAKSGSQLEILIIDEANPKFSPLGRCSGLTWNESTEQNPVEEVGNDGVDEIVDGKMTYTFSLTSFLIPKQNDTELTRRNFKGKRFTILQVTSSKWPNAGVVISALTGCKFSGRGVSQNARGLVGNNVSGMACNRYTGEEWAALTGQQ
jgi:hypothetical protein